MSLEVMRLIKVRAQFEPDVREQMSKSPLSFLSDYDLTDDEKRQIILPHFEWLVTNRIAALSYPESQDAFTLLWQIGIKALLNLAEASLPPNKAGIVVIHIPIKDFTAPTLNQVVQALIVIKNCLNRSMPIGVHCVAGLGRTGTILACYLVDQGESANKAIEAIRSWRFGSIETPEQEAIVHEYERYCRSR